MTSLKKMPYYNEEDKDINKLKHVLMSLVASSRQEMDMQLLLKEYRRVSGYIPLEHYGYTCPYKFLREQLSDCFEFGDSGSNSKLTLKGSSPVLQDIDQTMKCYRKNSKSNGKSQNVPKPSVSYNTPPQPQQASNTSSTDRENTACATAKKVVKNKKGYKKRNKAAAPPPQSKFDSDWDDSGEGENGIMGKRLVTVGPDGQKVVDIVGLKRTMWKLSYAEKIKRWKAEEPLREVRNLVLETPKGIWSSQLMRLYRERYGRELDYSFCITLPMFVSSVPDVKLTYFRDRGDTLLSHPNRRIQYSMTLDACVFPLECMQPGDTIRANSTVAQTVVGHTMKVIVTEVYSPSIFWLQRVEDIAAFEKLESEMTFHYPSEGFSSLHPEAVQVGTYCVCTVGGYFRRSVIVKLIGDDKNFRTRTVKVLQVDYGVVKTVPARMLLPLRREFARLDALAVRARLAGVRPRHRRHSWQHATCNQFDDMVNGRRASATVTAVDLTDLSLEVNLTVENEDLSVAEDLLLALDAEPRSEPAIGMQMPYLYPGFSALEKNATPNLSEIREFLRNGVDIYSLEDYQMHMPPKHLCISDSAANQPPRSPAPLMPPRKAVRFQFQPWMLKGKFEALQVDKIAPAAKNVTPRAENVTPQAEKVAPPAVTVTLTSDEINHFIDESILSPAIANFYMTMVLREKIQIISALTGEQSSILDRLDLLI